MVVATHHLKWTRSDDQNWIADILDGRAFTRRERPPEVILEAMMTQRRHHDCENARKPPIPRPSLLYFKYDFASQFITYTYQSREYGVQQVPFTYHGLGDRGNVHALCDASSEVDVRYKQIERCIERDLSLEERTMAWWYVTHFSDRRSEHDEDLALIDMWSYLFASEDDASCEEVDLVECQNFFTNLAEGKPLVYKIQDEASAQDFVKNLKRDLATETPAELTKTQEKAMHSVWRSFRLLGTSLTMVDASTLVMKTRRPMGLGDWNDTYKRLYK